MRLIRIDRELERERRKRKSERENERGSCYKGELVIMNGYSGC